MLVVRASGCPQAIRPPLKFVAVHPAADVRALWLSQPWTERYLVSMLGPGSDWVKNVEAARGEAVIRQGRRRRVRLVTVPPEQRAPILHEYVRVASSGRQHLPLTVGAPLSDFAAIADHYPVYRIDPS